jgi:hypothetical protein
VNPKPHHHRHRWFSERTLGIFFIGFVVVVILALLVLFLWWTNRPTSLQ